MLKKEAPTTSPPGEMEELGGALSQDLAPAKKGQIDSLKWLSGHH